MGKKNEKREGSGSGVFEAMGPSKNAYFETKKNGPKMIQKWFKIAQIT